MLHALREPATRYGIVGHQRSHNVSHQTAANDFHDLVARGLLAMLPGGRPRPFIAPSDLGDKLATGSFALWITCSNRAPRE